MIASAPFRNFSSTTLRSIEGRRPKNLLFRLSLLLQSFCCCVMAVSSVQAQPTTAPGNAAEIATIEQEKSETVAKVQAIVNQPVGALRQTPGMHVSISSPGWFHEGASKPDFNSVDVRLTQEAVYDKHQYVSSDLNPGLAFVGRQLEFNAMTKYFYTNRSLPKKKLSEAEMVEINRLYRIIGRCEKQLAKLRPRPALVIEPESEEAEPTPKYEPVPKGNYVKAALGVSVVLLLYFGYRKFR